MESLRIHLLGGFELSAPTPLREASLPRKARALIAYVALARTRSVPRDRIAALLWPEGDEAQARASLRQALAAIRRAAPLVDSDSELVALTAAVATVDVWELEALGGAEPDEVLEQALRLYRGELLAGLRVEAPGFDDWRHAENERLRTLASGIGAELVERLCAAGAYGRAAENATRLLALDPLREDTHRRLMQSYLHLGRPAEALRQYQRCRALLATELGVRPDAQTEALHAQIVDARRKPGVVTPTTALAASEPASPEPRAAALGARETVIVLSDLAGFTAFASSEDVEQVHDFLTRYREAVRGVATAFGGMLTNFIGARVMMVFGAPVAHGNDALRALHAALALRDLPAVAWAAADAPGLQVRAGVASGRAIAAWEAGQFTVTGGPVSVAGRILEVTQPGEIWIAETVLNAVSDRVDAEPLPNARIAALVEPLGLWRLRGIGRVTRDRSVAFAGRSRELAQMHGAFRQITDSGQGLVLTVVGEPGIGKTRLLAEGLQRAATLGFAVHFARVLDFGGGAAADPVRVLLSGLLDIDSQGDAFSRGRALDHAIDRHRIAAERRTALADLLDIPLPERAAALWNAMDDGVRAEARRQALLQVVAVAANQLPLVLAVEDFHWADARTSDLIGALCGSVARLPLLLMVTTRPRPPADTDPWHATPSALHRRIELTPMAPDEALRLAWAYGIDDAAFLQDCVTRAQGHPLFLDQLLRFGSEQRSRIPGSIQNVVLARVDVLGPAERHALRAAAVLGQHMSRAALHWVLDGAPFDGAALVAQQLLREEEEGWAFTHALIREAVLASILNETRLALHRRAATWFAPRDPALEAEHLAGARDPQAPRAFRDAALHEAERHRSDRALMLADRGLACAPDPGLEVELLCLSAEAMADGGAMVAAEARYRQAIAAARSDAGRCRAMIGVAAVLRVLDRQQEALDVLQEAALLADRIQDARAAARVQLLRGSACFPLGQLEACRTAYERALHLAEGAGAVDLQASALGGLGDAYYLIGRFATAHRYFGNCVELAQARRLTRVEIANRPMLAYTCAYRTELVAAMAHLDGTRTLARSIGDWRAEVLVEDIAAGVALITGDWSTAQACGRRCIELAQRLGARRFEADGLANVVMALWGAGAIDEDLDGMLARAWDLIAPASLAYSGPIILVARARIASTPEARERALVEGERLLAGDCVSHNYTHFYDYGIDIALDHGQPARAADYARALAAYIGPEPLPWSDLIVTRGIALSRFEQGDRSEALFTELRALRSRLSAVGMVPQLRRIDAALSMT